jgi:hypothetical protein
MRLSVAFPYVACGVLAAGAFALLVAPMAPAAASVAAPTHSATAPDVHEVLADFHEDEQPSRVVASLAATLTRTARGARLHVTASALGPRVVPPPGFEGVAGSNEIAARELRTLRVGDRCEVLVRRGDVVVGPGRVRGGRAAPVPIRRLDADGTVRERAGPAETGPVEAVFTADVPDGGEATVEVSLDGHVRVRAVCRVVRDEVRIVSLCGVSAHTAPVGAP